MGSFQRALTAALTRPRRVNASTVPGQIAALVQRLDTHHGLRFGSKRRSNSAIPVTARALSLTLWVDCLSGLHHLSLPRRTMMRFYQQQHPFYCGVDLHARTMHVCLVDQAGQVLVHKNIESRPDRFLQLIRPYSEGLAVAAECMFAWVLIWPTCRRLGPEGAEQVSPGSRYSAHPGYTFRACDGTLKGFNRRRASTRVQPFQG